MITWSLLVSAVGLACLAGPVAAQQDAGRDTDPQVWIEEFRRNYNLGGSHHPVRLFEGDEPCPRPGHWKDGVLEAFLGARFETPQLTQLSHVFGIVLKGCGDERLRDWLHRNVERVAREDAAEWDLPFVLADLPYSPRSEAFLFELALDTSLADRSRSHVASRLHWLLPDDEARLDLLMRFWHSATPPGGYTSWATGLLLRDFPNALPGRVADELAAEPALLSKGHVVSAVVANAVNMKNLDFSDPELRRLETTLQRIADERLGDDTFVRSAAQHAARLRGILPSPPCATT